MDFLQYVDARRVTLVRAAVLLGVAESEAPRIVDATLLENAWDVERSSYPDPDVYAALVRNAAEESSRPPDDDEPGAAVRRALADTDPTVRRVAVLAYFAHLIPHETAEALDVPAPDVSALEAEARDAIGARTEENARELMVLASDTVEIGTLKPLQRPARDTRWAALAGVGGVLVCVLAIAALVGGGATPAPPPNGPLRDNQVPSLFGYDVPSARRLLSGRGLEVGLKASPACEPVGLVVGTDPPLGTRVDDGDTVTLLTASPYGYSCEQVYRARSDAWDFLGFAAGRRPAPAFAAHVEAVVDGTPIRLTRPQARDPENWGDPSALTLLADAMAQVYDVPDSPIYRTPSLDADVLVPPPRRCGIARPQGTAHRQALTLTLAVYNVGPYLCPLRLDVYRTPAGAIDVVALYTAQPLTS